MRYSKFSNSEIFARQESRFFSIQLEGKQTIFVIEFSLASFTHDYCQSYHERFAFMVSAVSLFFEGTLI